MFDLFFFFVFNLIALQEINQFGKIEENKEFELNVNDEKKIEENKEFKLNETSAHFVIHNLKSQKIISTFESNLMIHNDLGLYALAMKILNGRHDFYCTQKIMQLIFDRNILKMYSPSPTHTVIFNYYLNALSELNIRDEMVCYFCCF